MTPAEVRAFVEAHGFIVRYNADGKKVVACSGCLRLAVYLTAEDGKVCGIICPGNPRCVRTLRGTETVN